MRNTYSQEFGDGFLQIYDIVLLRLSRKVTYTKYIQPICLPPRDLPDSYFDGADLVATSWGRTSIGGKITHIACVETTFCKAI